MVMVTLKTPRSLNPSLGLFDRESSHVHHKSTYIRRKTPGLPVPFNKPRTVILVLFWPEDPRVVITLKALDINMRQGARVS